MSGTNSTPHNQIDLFGLLADDQTIKTKNSSLEMDPLDFLLSSQPQKQITSPSNANPTTSTPTIALQSQNFPPLSNTQINTPTAQAAAASFNDGDFADLFFDHFEKKSLPNQIPANTPTIATPNNTQNGQTSPKISTPRQLSLEGFVYVDSANSTPTPTPTAEPNDFSSTSGAPQFEDDDGFLFTFVERGRADQVNTLPYLQPGQTNYDSTHLPYSPTSSTTSTTSTSTTTAPRPARPSTKPTFPTTREGLFLETSTDNFIDINTAALPSPTSYNYTTQGNKNDVLLKPSPNTTAIPCLYTVKNRPGQSASAYVDVGSSHFEHCELTKKLGRNVGDECSCGGMDLSQFDGVTKADKRLHSEMSESAISPLNDTNSYTDAPVGSISSTQCTLEDKSKFIQHCLFTQPPKQQTEPAFVKIYSLTYNHYELIPTVSTFSSLLPPNPLDFQIYAISFQEAGGMFNNQAQTPQVTQSAVNSLNNQAKGTPYTWKLIACDRLLSLFTFVIARSDIVPYIHKVTTQGITTGFGGVVGNKGGAVIRMFIKNTSFAFVGCHFAAGQKDLVKRNSDYHRINAKCNLGLADMVADRDNAMSKPVTPAILQNLHKLLNPASYKDDANPKLDPTDSVKQLAIILNAIKIKYRYNHMYSSAKWMNIAHLRVATALKQRHVGTGIDGKVVYTFTGSLKKDDVVTNAFQLYEYKNDIISRTDVVIWLGDLNYRVAGLFGDGSSLAAAALENDSSSPDSSTLRERVFELLSQGQHTTLLTRYEQLSTEKEISGTIFHGFKEGAITFPPSYKYDVGTQTFDTSQKSRIPAWTDRILYIDNCSQCYHDYYQQCDCISDPANVGQQCLFATKTTTATAPALPQRKVKRTQHHPCQRTLLERYGSLQTVNLSDHKPVFAYFYVNIAEQPPHIAPLRK